MVVIQVIKILKTFIIKLNFGLKLHSLSILKSTLKWVMMNDCDAFRKGVKIQLIQNVSHLRSFL